MSVECYLLYITQYQVVFTEAKQNYKVKDKMMLCRLTNIKEQSCRRYEDTSTRRCIDTIIVNACIVSTLIVTMTMVDYTLLSVGLL
jgi:hypothetical protein